MPDHVAVKLLTEKSDLGWFRSIFERRGLAGKQKGITLGAEVFRRFYPVLGHRIEAYRRAKARQKDAMAATPPDRVAFDRAKSAARAAGSIPVVATVFGPDGGAPFSRNRIIALQDKNWRLNGAFILDPDGEPDRFDPILRDGDIAVIGFEGEEQPTAVSVLLLAAGSPADAALHADLRALLSRGAGSMVRIDPSDLAARATALGLPEEHPAWILATDTAVERDLEEAARGDERAARRVGRRKGRALTPEELAAGRAAAEWNGALGEELVNLWLDDKAGGGPARHRWVSSIVANAPFDFEVLDASGALERVADAKTTSSGFASAFYISFGELVHAAGSPVPYHIWRVSEVGPAGAWLRQSSDFRPFAQEIIRGIEAAFPAGTRPSVMAVSPFGRGVRMNWGSRIRLHPKVPVAPPEDLPDQVAEAEEEDDGPAQDMLPL